jgi:hypothetical protein
MKGNESWEQKIRHLWQQQERRLVGRVKVHIRNVCIPLCKEAYYLPGES